ncbi:HNH endonuclease signature motif containing protein [Speluncibacter jeojiensis]|uniref:HNH endonuclease n=1 Tax=Speluncibacter jeojiensis TaxID=2710754 RepID=A0A9X4RFC2_9ACTN|nr:HNH endonuclease signature motif containing protein [Rhodococcus sp. D2-41]MDG3016132.1 HNH endonuclease [Corynebacteriales bacterium D3-21]
MEHHLAALDSAVEGLLTESLTGLSEADVVESLQRMEVSLRKASVVGHRLIVESVERSIPGNLACKSINDFLITTLRISAGDAARRVKGAKKVGTWHTVSGDEMDATLLATAAAVRAGTIGPDHVAAIAKTIRKVPHSAGVDEIAVAEQILADLACSTTPEDVTKAGIHLLAHLNPDGDVPEERERKRRRGIRIGKQGADLLTPMSGMLDPELRALLDPVLAKLARPGMNNPDDPESPSGDADSPTLDRAALAQAAARDGRTPSQRNHDAMKVALQSLLSSGALGSHRGLPVTAIITMTLQQLEVASGVVTTASGGIIPIKDALLMAENAHPVLVLFDHNGRPLHLGRSRRLASADQRLALIAASRGCTRPGCDAPATIAAVHHVTEWKDGGGTDITNEDLACDHCHALVHEGPGGWKTEVAPPGAAHPGCTEWTAPPHIDPEQTPQVNHRHHLDQLIAGALARYRARCDAGLRRRRAQWEPQDRRRTGESDESDGDVP